MITTTFLELYKTDFPTVQSRNVLSLVRNHSALVCADMYANVGSGQYWGLYRFGWGLDHWAIYLLRQDIEVHFIVDEGCNAVGYAELKIDDNGIEIVNFGLLPQYIGHGLGGDALALVAKYAFTKSTKVWLHTCSLDHPAALHNYYARGFKLVREEVANSIPLDELPVLMG
jgi:GNAT superfamily N-acetyltransferase